MSKRTIIIFGTLIVLSVLFLAFRLYQAQQTKQAEVSGDTAVVASEEFGVSFSYQKGENGFSLVEPDGKDRGILKSYLLMPTEEFEAYQKSTDASEAPANISLFIFELDTSAKASTTRESRITQLQNWASDNSTFTSIKLAKATPEVVEVDGAQALHYQADGLYQQDVYLVAYKARVYMFIGQYDKDTDVTYTGFQELIKTVSFD